MNITEAAVADFTGLLETPFELGILKDDRMLIRAVDRDKILNATQWLKFQNVKGAHIYIRPQFPHQYCLLDDLAIRDLRRAADLGILAAVETSPGNYQAWIKHPRLLEPALSTAVAQFLADSFRADPSSADFRHFGRLPGFTNRKQKHRRPDGNYPFTKLLRQQQRTPWTGSLIKDCEAALLSQKAANARRRTKTIDHVSQGADRCRSISFYHQHPRFSGDLHRADFAYAINAALWG
ncbi:DNA-primase RepB domain-containing protein, partial [Roseibium sp.]|uniref:DNA-primase RepB domain-containing protein n=1 Tax=Roseibium sp. TaxID=1936156 RepID=UPI0032986830